MTQRRRQRNGRKFGHISLEWSWIYTIAAILALAGVLMLIGGRSIEAPNDFWSEVVSEVGLALIIAAILMAGSEPFLKRSLFSEIETEISNTLESFRLTAFDLQQYQRLRPELREGIQNQILKVPVIQRDVIYEYSLTEVTIDDKIAYKADMISHSIYENISTEQRRFRVKEILPAYTFRTKMSDYGFVELTTQIKNDESSKQTFVARVIKNHVSEMDSGTPLYNRVFELDSGEELQVEFKGIAYIKPEDWISHEAFLPTINMVCKIYGAGLEFDGQSVIALSEMWDLDLEDNGEHRWELKGAILPGQGFDIWIQDDEQ